MKKWKLCLIGNGIAGLNVMEHILKLAPNQYEMTIIGKETRLAYNRTLLSAVLNKEAELDDLIVANESWYQRRNIRLLTGVEVTRMDTREKHIYTDTGERISYDLVIFATGSRPKSLPIPGIQLNGVLPFRDWKDCEQIISRTRPGAQAVVIGGGVLGLETARGLACQQMNVTVVHQGPSLMERQLDQSASNLLQAELAKEGIRFLLNRKVERILGEQRVEGIRFGDGEEVVADFIVLAVGAQPETRLARTAGITVKQGIVVNDYMETNIPGVYAVGDCVEHRGVVYGTAAPLYHQGAVLAKNLCGVEAESYQGSVVGTKLQVGNIELFSAGEFDEQKVSDALVVRQLNEWHGIYKKILIKQRRIVGAILYGDTSESARLFKLIREKREVNEEVITSFFSRNPEPLKTTVPDWISPSSDEDYNCHCNRVTKEWIIQAITQRGLTTVEEVCKRAGFSATCPRCRPLILQLLQQVYGHQPQLQLQPEPQSQLVSHNKVLPAMIAKTYPNEYHKIPAEANRVQM